MPPPHFPRFALGRPGAWRLALAMLWCLVHAVAALAATMGVAPPTGITSSGNAGGPFSSASTTYTISNTGSAPITWTAANATAWLSLSSPGGSIGVGENATVVATINASANTLSIGKYSDTITITNATDGTGNAALPVYLSVTANGTWTPLAHTAPGSVDLMHLLLDGTVIAHDGDFGWFKLTPDSTGSYVNGTWSTLTSSYDSRLYFSSQILLDGRLLTAGGEYGTGTRTGEVYDPLTNTWTITPVPGVGFVDSVSEILNSGQVLIDPVEPSASGYTILYNPSTNTWATGPKLVHGYNEDEATWIKLPDDSILTIDSETTTSERYIPSLNQWVADSTVPVTMYDSSLGELGPGFLLPNGQAFMLGGTSNTAYYTPSGTTAPGTWVAGPEIPDGLGINDGVGAMMVTGKVLFVAGPPTTYDGPTTYFIFDSVANTITQVNGPTGTTSSNPPFTTAMVDLPDGTVLYSTFGTQLYVYSPSGAPLSEGKPTISAVTQNADGSFHLTGMLLNGISEGTVYGDDAQMATNYPIVRLISSGGSVYFARTANRSTTSVMTGSATLSTDFYLPAGLPAGTYSLITAANGISSDPLPISFSPITVSLPASAMEGSAPVTGTVTLPSAPSSNLQVNLACSDASRASVPSSITVLAGQTTATFSLTVIEQSLLNGNEAVIISAAAAGYQTGNTPFVVVNNESAVLSVSPTTDYIPSGAYGGPFSPGTSVYTLTNTGTSTLSWTAAKSQSWLSLSSTGGTLAAGTNTTVTATMAASANTLFAGSYTDTIIFDNITTGAGDTGISVSLTVTGTPSMSVTSGAFSSSGTTGGPFSPSSAVYTISNPGSAPFNWTAAKTQSWVTLSSTSGTVLPGGTANVTVSINSAANALAAGGYNDTVTFTNTTNGNGNTTRAVSLTIIPAAATMSVAPAKGFSALGDFGGPFFPASGAYTITNIGGATLSWSASNASAWLTVAPASGSLNPGANAVVTVSLTSGANTLLPGGYTDAVSFTNLTNGNGNTSIPAMLTVGAVAPTLRVTPATGSSFAGPYGGPFSSGAATYTIYNLGTGPMTYAVTPVQAWLNVSPAGGIIAAGGNVTVTAAVSSRANSFVNGNYAGTLAFKNLTTGLGSTTCPVTLAVAGIPALRVAATGVDASGSAGGPFSPVTTAIRLTNPGTAPVTWAASANVNWLSFLPSGTIGTESGANFLVSVNSNASAQTPGVYATTITITNTSNGTGNATVPATLTVYPPGPLLVVSPAAGLASSGAHGGPFTPASVSYTLFNGGNATMSWTASNTSPWLTVSPASGTLWVGTASTVTATINSAANTLASGSYTDAIAFANVTNGTGNTSLPVSLAVGGTTPSASPPRSSFAAPSVPAAAPPSVAIASPGPGPNTTRSSLGLQGSASSAGSGIAMVAVNGQAASSSNGFSTWSLTGLPLALGLNTVTATAVDNASPTPSTASAAMTLTRVPNATGDGLPDAWKLAYGLDPADATGNNGPLGNPANDGVPNILKYAFNLDPQKGSVVPANASVTINPVDGLPYLTLTYIQRTDTIDLTYVVEVSTDLQTWATPASAMTQLSAAPNADGVTQTVTVQIGSAISAGTPALFTRVRVTLE